MEGQKLAGEKSSWRSEAVVAPLALGQVHFMPAMHGL